MAYIKKTKEQVIAERKKPQPKLTIKPKAQVIAERAKPQPKLTIKPKTTVKAPVKKKVLVMPDKISPSKMTPAQKARYLKNPERYDG
jgi:hypothetical protein